MIIMVISLMNNKIETYETKIGTIKANRKRCLAIAGAFTLVGTISGIIFYKSTGFLSEAVMDVSMLMTISSLIDWFRENRKLKLVKKEMQEVKKRHL